MDKQKVDNQAPVQKQKRQGIHQLLEDSVTSTYADITAIIEARIELLKIELTEKIAQVSVIVILGVILIIGLAYFITTIALLAGELLGHPFLGYLLVSLVFLACFTFFTKFKPFLLKNLIQNILLSVHDYKK
ncbi:MAG: phage holin family protein [Chlorobiaceae bacterium]|nr:phage holin family protein [Chlorobiaceae bacterium]